MEFILDSNPREVRRRTKRIAIVLAVFALAVPVLGACAQQLDPAASWAAPAPSGHTGSLASWDE